MRSKFPAAPGVYLFQDQAGRVLYVGKAKNLRARAGSYFLAAAADDQRTSQLVREAYDVDFLEAESEVDALLDGSPADQGHPAEVQPRPARRQELSLSADHDARRFSARRSHARAAHERREALRAVRQRRQPARGGAGAAEGVQVSHLLARHRGGRRAVAVVSAVPVGVDQSVHGPVQSADRARRSTARTSSGCGCFWKATASSCSPRCGRRWQAASAELKFEKAARLRDEIEMLESLRERGELEKHEQPEVFFIDPKKGLAGLQKILKLDERPRNIEGVDIAHLGGNETVASLVQFLDGLPFKPGYRRFRIRDVEGDRRLREHPRSGGPAVPQAPRRRRRVPRHPADRRRHRPAAQRRSRRSSCSDIKPPMVLSLAKQEELVYVPGRDEPLRLSRRSYALRLLQYVRDEAHRFAQHYHHLLRRKRQIGRIAATLLGRIRAKFGLAAKDSAMLGE